MLLAGSGNAHVDGNTYHENAHVHGNACSENAHVDENAWLCLVHVDANTCKRSGGAKKYTQWIGLDGESVALLPSTLQTHPHKTNDEQKTKMQANPASVVSKELPKSKPMQKERINCPEFQVALQSPAREIQQLGARNRK